MSNSSIEPSNTNMAAKKKPRIPRGNLNIGYDSIASAVEQLMDYGFTLADLEKTSVELDWSGCYYESDTPSVMVEWGDIN